MQIHHHQGTFVQDEFRRLSRPPILFLGSGASATSNLPTVADIEWELKLAIYQKESPNNDLSGTTIGELSQRDRLIVEDFLQRQPWYQGLAPQNVYSALLENVHPTPADREAYFQRLIDGAVPSIGYQHLAKLLKHSLFHAVATVNFDSLLSRCEDKLQIITPDIAFSDQKVKVSPKRPTLLELHGDYRFNPLQEEPLSVREGDEVLRRDLLTMLDEHPLLVVGYSGRDATIMEMLGTAVSLASMSAGFYWALLPLNDPTPQVKALMDKHLARGNPGGFVEITSFDHLMGELVRGYLRRDTAGGARATGPYPTASNTYKGGLPQSPYANDDISSITSPSRLMAAPGSSGSVNTYITPSQGGRTPSDSGRGLMNQGGAPTGRFQVMNTPSGQVPFPPSASGSVPSATNIVNTPTGQRLGMNTPSGQVPFPPSASGSVPSATNIVNTPTGQRLGMNTPSGQVPFPGGMIPSGPSVPSTGTLATMDPDDLPEPPRTHLGKIIIGVLLLLLLVVLVALQVAKPEDDPTAKQAKASAPPKPKVTLNAAGSESIGGTLLIASLEKHNIVIKGLDAFKYESIGSTGGIQKLVHGEVPLAGASRMMKDSDLEGTTAKVKPYVFAYDAVSIIANGMNRGLKTLSRKQLKGIFCGEITEWKQIGQATLGKIRVLDRDKDSGTRALIDDLVRGGCTASFEEAHQDVILQTIAQDPNAISYSAASLPLDQGTTLRVALSSRDGGEGFLPDESTILSGAYPLTRPLFFLARKDPEGASPEAEAFLQWLVSPSGVANVRAGGLMAAQKQHSIRSILEFGADSCSLSPEETHAVDNAVATAKTLAKAGNEVSFVLEGWNPGKTARVKAKNCPRVTTEKELVERRVAAVRAQLEKVQGSATFPVKQSIGMDLPPTVPPAWRGTAQHRVNLLLDFQ